MIFLLVKRFQEQLVAGEKFWSFARLEWRESNFIIGNSFGVLIGLRVLGFKLRKLPINKKSFLVVFCYDNILNFLKTNFLKHDKISVHVTLQSKDLLLGLGHTVATTLQRFARVFWINNTLVRLNCQNLKLSKFKI